MSKRTFAIRNRSQANLSKGTMDLIEGIHSRYPHLSDEDITVLANTVLSEVGKQIRVGKDIAFVKRNYDGSVDLTILGLEYNEAS